VPSVPVPDEMLSLLIPYRFPFAGCSAKVLD
jgi:hypothetical protein